MAETPAAAANIPVEFQFALLDQPRPDGYTQCVMKLITALSVCVATFLASIQGLARQHELKVQPLAGSAWAKEHPGLLPYEHCGIAYEGAQGDIMTRPTAGLGVLKTERLDSTFDDLRLVCFTEKFGLSFSIPIHAGSLHHQGLNLVFTSAIFNNRWMTVEHLDGKYVADLFGKYRGFEVGAQFFYGPRFEMMRNASHVRIRDVNAGIGLGTFLGRVTMTLAPGRMDILRCSSPYVLLDGTEARDLLLGCVGKIPLDFTKLGALRFMRVR